MYYYIVDPKEFSQKSFERIQNKLYSSLSDYRISGETVRVSSLRTIPQLVEVAFAHSAKTIIAVGNDETLNDVINAVKGREVIIGFIPLQDCEMGLMLGLRSIESACKTLALRRIALLDLGGVNNNYFLNRISFGLSADGQLANFFNFSALRKIFNTPSFEVKFSANNSFSGKLSVIAGLILNSRYHESPSALANPTDGVLDILLLPKLSRTTILKYRKDIAKGQFENIPQASLLHVNKMEITAPEGMPLRVGNKVLAKTPATIEVLPRALKIIVGKGRVF